MCSYSEWSSELGDMVRCGLPEHPLRPRQHGNWIVP
jgi:hypothetical protein